MMIAGDLFKILAKIVVPIKKYPSFPYDLYRYFYLLENLPNLNYRIDHQFSRPTEIIKNISFEDQKDRDWSGAWHAGTQQSQQEKKITRFVNEEALNAARYLIENRSWGDQQHLMLNFIEFNSDALQLHIRDIPTMMCAIFLFLRLRAFPNQNKNKILSDLNQILLHIINSPKKQEEKKEPQQKEEVLWGKDNDKGNLLIVKVTKMGPQKSKITKGALCMNKNVDEIQSILNKENVKWEKHDSKKQLCQLLKKYLQKKNRYFK